MPSENVSKQITKTNDGQYHLRSEQDAYNDTTYRHGFDATMAQAFGYEKTADAYGKEKEYQKKCLERFLDINEESEYAKKDAEKTRAYYSLSKSENPEMANFANEHTNRKGFRRRSKIETAAKKIEKSKETLRKANINAEINNEYPHVYAMAKMEALELRLSGMRYAAEAKGYHELDEERRKNLAEIKVKGAQLALIREVESEYRSYLRNKAKGQGYNGPDAEKKLVKVYRELMDRKKSIQEVYDKNRKEYEFNSTKYMLKHKDRIFGQDVVDHKDATDEEIRNLQTLNENGVIKYLKIQAMVKRRTGKNTGTNRGSLALLRVARKGEDQTEIINDACKYHKMYDDAKTDEEHAEMQRLLQKHLDSLVAGLPTPEQMKKDGFKWIVQNGDSYNVYVNGAGLDDNSTKDTVWGKKIFATEKGAAQKRLIERFCDLYEAVVRSQGISEKGEFSSFGEDVFTFGALAEDDMEEYKETIPDRIQAYEKEYNLYKNMNS